MQLRQLRLAHSIEDRLFANGKAFEEPLRKLGGLVCGEVGHLVLRPFLALVKEQRAPKSKQHPVQNLCLGQAQLAGDAS